MPQNINPRQVGIKAACRAPITGALCRRRPRANHKIRYFGTQMQKSFYFTQDSWEKSQPIWIIYSNPMSIAFGKPASVSSSKPKLSLSFTVGGGVLCVFCKFSICSGCAIRAAIINKKKIDGWVEIKIFL